jgi:hypothetical protein
VYKILFCAWGEGKMTAESFWECCFLWKYRKKKRFCKYFGFGENFSILKAKK